MPTWSDGDVDATAAWFYGARLDFYLNDGAATLAPAGFLPVAAAASYAWAHDLDRDGNLDLSVVGELAPQHGGDAGSRPVAAGPTASALGSAGRPPSAHASAALAARRAPG